MIIYIMYIIVIIIHTELGGSQRLGISLACLKETVRRCTPETQRDGTTAKGGNNGQTVYKGIVNNHGGNVWVIMIFIVLDNNT